MEDAIGSKEAEYCETHRFNEATALVDPGKISQQQGYNPWRYLFSNKESVRKVFDEAVAAKELTRDQIDWLLPQLDMEMEYETFKQGTYEKKH